jgi:ribosomal protein S18 acetylase RimI-like enzyme
MRDVAAMVKCDAMRAGLTGERRFGALLEGLGMGAMALFVAQGGQSGVSVGSGVAAVQSEGAIGLAPAQGQGCRCGRMMDVMVRFAAVDDVPAVKAIADRHRHELGFVPAAALVEAAQERRLLVAVLDGKVIGFVHFRCCRDGHATIYEIAVLPEHRQRGVGRALVGAVVQEAVLRGCVVLQLKCPIDLSANEFYRRAGFTEAGIEEGKRRPLRLWQKRLDPAFHCLPADQLPIANRQSPPFHQSPVAIRQSLFYASAADFAWRMRRMVRLFYDAYSGVPPFHPFERQIVTPLFAPKAVLRALRAWREGIPPVDGAIPPVRSVIFDSGGYQVQTGRLSFDELVERLLPYYRENAWADFLVLPDHVPRSSDSDREVAVKVEDTLRAGEEFLKRLPHLRERFIGVVHARTVEQVRFAVRHWASLGITYVAFGSFGTSGPKGSINKVSKESEALLFALQDACAEFGLSFHLFGIGGPAHLQRLRTAGIVPTSLDSAGWWKAAGSSRVFLPNRPELSVSERSKGTAIRSASEWDEMRQAAGHECPFCRDFYALQQDRWHRMLHNLVVVMECLSALAEGDSLLTSRQSLIASRQLALDF